MGGSWPSVLMGHSTVTADRTQQVLAHGEPCPAVPNRPTPPHVGVIRYNYHMSNPPQHLLWMDLESTTSDPTLPHAALLEVGAVITEWAPDLPEVARASMVIRPPGTAADHDRMWAAMPDVVRRMHTVNGLWEQATTDPDAWALHEADDAIAGWIRRHAGAERLPIAGSGVGHLDLPFLKIFMPRVVHGLTYWPLDIGSTRRMIELAGRPELLDLARDVEAKPHRGLADVLMHIDEARHYLRLLSSLAPLERPAVTMADF